MNHSILAGAFCTLATLFLVVEILTHHQKIIGQKFLFMYFLGCCSWTILGMISHQMPLFLIGLIQAFAMISTYLIVRTKENSK